jgi:hypothetical protein
MAISPLPAPLQQLGGRRFAFYPPIRNIDHNEWLYRRANWNEVVVVNARTGGECVIPRAQIGEVSYADDPHVVVTLRQELEAQGGIVRAWRCPVIEMPACHTPERPEAPPREKRADVVSIRLEQSPESRGGVRLAVGLVLSAIGCLTAANIVRSHVPASEHSVRTADGQIYRLVRYPGRRSVTVLDSRSRYLGMVDMQGRVLSSARLADGSDAAPLLRSLPPF